MTRPHRRFSLAHLALGAPIVLVGIIVAGNAEGPEATPAVVGLIVAGAAILSLLRLTAVRIRASVSGGRSVRATYWFALTAAWSFLMALALTGTQFMLVDATGAGWATPAAAMMWATGLIGSSGTLVAGSRAIARAPVAGRSRT
jgi:hypothetical protein